MSLFSLPIRRPVATSMFFLAIVLLGCVGWKRIPVELVPALAGDELYLQFYRPGSEPDVVEREILLPLEAKVSEIAGVEESWGEIRGSGGNLRVRFERGTDLKIRELELATLAADMVRAQPEGAFVQVFAQDFSAASRFVMVVEVAGGEDRSALRDLVDERITPRLTAVPGVSRVLASGGASREVTVRVDPERCVATGVQPLGLTSALVRSIERLRFVGGCEDEQGRTAVMLDGRPQGLVSLAETRVATAKPVLLRHVADIEYGAGREQLAFRVNGKPAVGLILFQEEGANLVRLGRSLRQRVAELNSELGTYGIELVVGFDAARTVEEQLDRLAKLGLSGFVIALIVLYLFLREPRAVAVVATAVPVSLLAAVAFLYVGGWTINLITLFGLAVGIGMLVDNSIVVYEAVQRLLERGASPDAAAVGGIRRTVRAIAASSATNAIVFVPVAFTAQQTIVRGMFEVLAIAIVLPLLASLLVAVGLVPMLARFLAAPAAAARLRDRARRREALAGLVRPDRGRELFSGVLKVALRRPAGWLTGCAAAIVLTVVIALPVVLVSTTTAEAPQADEVALRVEIPAGESLEAAGEVFGRLERAALDIQGVRSVESVFDEDGGTLTVRLADPDDRPEELTAGGVRTAVRKAAKDFKGKGVEIPEAPSDGFGSGSDQRGGAASLMGQGPAEVRISGPDARLLAQLATEIEERLESISEVESVWTSARAGQEEIRVEPDRLAMAALGLTADQVLPALSVVRREGLEMRTGFTMADGREVPLVVRRSGPGRRRAGDDIESLRLATPAGAVPLGSVATARVMPPPPTIQHHNGRRELSVFYGLRSEAPRTGPARRALDEEIRRAIREAHRPPGYIIDAQETDESVGWFKRTLIPVLLLLLAVLAITFESLTMPALVMVAVPLTLLGATWALVFAGTPVDRWSLVGAVALLGLTVNPGILLVDRMQRRAREGVWSAGAAALAAVRERARPVLMTSCTTVAGLWPLALRTGREMEVWPSFATVVMGGLVTSTLLTLLVIPVGYVLLAKLDGIFGRLGPWVVLGWLTATTAVMAPLIVSEQISSMRWQIATTALVGAALLGVAVLLLRRAQPPEPVCESGPPVVEVRYLRKVYGRPGPIGRALRSGRDFAQRVLDRGGRPFEAKEALEKALSLAVVLGGVGYLALSLQTMWWRLVFSMVAAGVGARLLIEVRRARGRCDALGRVSPGGPEGVLAALAPWLVLLAIGMAYYLLPHLAGERERIAPAALALVAVVIATVQLGRRTAVRIAAGRIPERVDEGWLRRVRTTWRRVSRRLFGLDLPREEVEALAAVHLRAERGMVGILGPNGAGKTTLLRLLAGILEPSLGTITIGGVPLAKIRRHLARWVGYLPQDFGLPENLTAREYLEYYALLYDLGDDGAQRVEDLLTEVGLGQRADERIGSYSGGMRQRVAVARTLLRLPAIIIVDEPTVGLDPRERIRFRNLLGRLAEGRIVLFSTHVVEDVAVACERVVVLSRGEVVYDGEPAAMTAQAAGAVWEWQRPGDVELELPADALVVDQVPSEDGVVRTRILSPTPPHPDARPAAPTLEDAYLWLVRQPDAQEAA